jgi:hypothetical protein
VLGGEVMLPAGEVGEPFVGIHPVARTLVTEAEYDFREE